MLLTVFDKEYTHTHTHTIEKEHIRDHNENHMVQKGAGVKPDEM